MKKGRSVGNVCRSRSGDTIRRLGLETRSSYKPGWWIPVKPERSRVPSVPRDVWSVGSTPGDVSGLVDKE